MSRPSAETFCLEVEVRGCEVAERVAAEAWSSGVTGVEERESEGRTTLLLYAPAECVKQVEAAASSVAGARVVAVQPVVDTDWSEAWREGLEPVHVGERLIVRPGWIPVELVPGQVEVVVDPGQAFGTGGHASTRLALEWIESVAREEDGIDDTLRVLDVGAGTGVLAVSALRLGAGHAVGFDLDPLAGEAARETAARNGLADRFDVFVGPISALGGAPFDLVLANLLKREMLPVAGAIAAATRPGGRAIFSGLLAGEQVEVESGLASAGFEGARARRGVDANGDEWVALLMTRA